MTRVLVAEDSPTQAARLRAELEQEGFEVLVASDGSEALDRLMVEPVDLVVSDVVMPDVGGYELCRRVKERDPEVPVVLLTAMDDPMDVVEALLAGADNFLRKPYRAEDLIHRLRSILYNRERRAAGHAQMGLELYFMGRRFMINADREQILDLLISTFEELVAVNDQLRERERELAAANDEVSLRLVETERERERARAIVDSIPRPMVVVDLDGTVISVNDHLGALLDIDSSRLVGTSVWEVPAGVTLGGSPISPSEWPLAQSLTTGEASTMGTAFDLFIERPDGTRFPAIVNAGPIRSADGAVIGAMAILEDIASLSAHDPAVGLPGHAVLLERIRAAAEAGRQPGAPATVLLILVVDRYATVRDGLGLGATDELVATVVERLRVTLQSEAVTQLCPKVTAAYLGNGEIALIVPTTSSEAEALVIAEVIVRELAGRVELSGVDLPVTVTIAAGLVESTIEPEALVRSVAGGARRATLEGGNRVTTGMPEVHAEVLRRLHREQELREALASDQLVAHYQPEVDLLDGTLVAVEALVRWEHPRLGLLGAGEIVPLAIDSGLIAEVSWRVLETACEQMARWHERLDGAENLALSVNLAAEQLVEPDVADRIRRTLAGAGLDPRALILEVTEASVMEDHALARTRLEQIKSLGVQIALDDFGTGHSSLLQLRRMPVDILKIDRAFVGGMTDDDADAAIVAGTVRLARALGLQVVAEGVENLDQLVRLRVLGCDLGQGYHWSRPIGAAEFEEFYAAHQSTVVSRGREHEAWDPGFVDDRLDDTIAYLVHELQTPIAAIGGFAELLARSAPLDVAQYSEPILRNVRELSDRIAGIRESREVLSRGVSLDFAATDVRALVSKLVESLAGELDPHPVVVHGSGDVMAYIDPSRTSQAITNLLTNAAKFSPSHSPIEVSVSQERGVVRVTVRDHGPGIPVNRRPELFRRFSRLGSRTKGMGIGLYLARTIAIAHGGTLEYEPAADGGSIFVFEVPSGLGAEAPTATPSGERSREDAGRLPVTVLYIDDSASNREVIGRFAETLSDIQMLVAADGATGLTLAAHRRPDLILLDLNLPDLGGEEVLRELKRDPTTADIPVVITTAGALTAQQEAAVADASAVLLKPVRLEELRAVIDASTGRPTQGPDRPLAHDDGPHVLDPAIVAALHEVAARLPSTAQLASSIRAYISHGADFIQELRHRVSSGERDVVARVAHLLAGESGAFGAVVVAVRCRALEAAAGTDTEVELGALVDSIDAAFDEAASHLRREFGL